MKTELSSTTADPPSNLQQELQAIARRYQVDEIYVFGSRANEIAGRVRGQTMSPELPRSDVDIGVRPATGRQLDIREKVQLAMKLEDLLGVNRVDVVVLPEADPFLAVNVIRGELLVCADPHAQAEYELYLLRRAGDLAPLERERMALILERVR
jgi:predicted nucleotidyltransferase